MRRAAALTVAALALVAATAASAEAHGGQNAVWPKGQQLSTYCGSQMPAAFDALGRFTGRAGYGSFARGGAPDIVKEPSSTDVAEEVPASARGKGGKRFSATVDVWFHVVSDGAIGNVSDQAIQDQMTVLNMGYGGLEGGVNTGFKFRLVGVDRTDNAAWFYTGPGTSDERDMKKALHKGDASTFNVYSTTAGLYLGWAYFPSTYKTKPWIDGLVIDWESMPGTSTRYAGAYDLGKTATHEAGHWFGLYHVFQGGCNHWGDYVDDTPPQLIATRGCPEGQDSCREPGLDSIHNYMDYSYDSCYNQFTAGQSQRMQDQWLYFRADGGTTVKG
jgi:pregnancy-associated plasma protein-A